MRQLAGDHAPSAVLVIGAGQGDAIADLGGERRQVAVVEPNPRAPGLSRLGPRVEALVEPSYLALPALIEAGRRFGLAFIDGRHLFDHLLLDLFYADRLLLAGGVVAVNNATWPGLRKAIAYFETNRAYSRLEAPERLALLHKKDEDAREGNRRDDAGLLYAPF